MTSHSPLLCLNSPCPPSPSTSLLLEHGSKKDLQLHGFPHPYLGPRVSPPSRASALLTDIIFAIFFKQEKDEDFLLTCKMLVISFHSIGK